MLKFSEFVNEVLLKGAINFKEIEKQLKKRADFQAGLTTIEGYTGPDGYTVKYKGKQIFSEKKGILLDRISHNEEVQKLAELIAKVFKVKINMKDYDELDKKWLKIWHIEK